MEKKLGIEFEAKLSTSGAEQAAKRLDDQLKKTGKSKIDPVPPDAVRRVDALFQTFLKMDREMARRLKVTGQEGRGPDQVDWNPVYQNAKSREKKMRQLQAFLQNGGADFQPPPGSSGGGGNWRNTAGGMAAGVAQAGLRAAGPVGNVAANALGTGMSAGAGAGLMGLVGGLAALGVGKLVGAIVENIEKAENNNIAYDRLKRTLGDVNVSFAGLKSAVKSAGEGLNITYDESERLSTQFAKMGNVNGPAYKSLPEGLGLGVGLSRSFGLDPSQGVGVLGQMRGVGVTRDTQESRRMALLIGETIAKSDAFAKADEVMEAIAGFATAQTRQSMSAANVAGYGGLFSSMVSSGLAGMDPQGANSIISRMNSSLSAGGARGEASQFFTSMVGNRMGLDPLQMQVLREGGAFASKDQMFGVGSAYTRYMGQTGPTGGNSFLEETRKLIEEKYAGDSETQKLMRAQAFGNHTGLNMNQSMAVLSLQPNQMGEMQKYAGNMTGLSASGIRNMSAALFGSSGDRAALAESFGNRSDVSQSDKDSLKSVMANGTLQQQKDMLAKLSAQYEQERTMGSDIRDSRALLENIKIDMADKAVPALLEIKKGILHLAGGGNKTPGQVRQDIAKGESEDRISGINERYEGKISSIDSKKSELIKAQTKLFDDYKHGKIEKPEFTKRLKEYTEQFNGLEAAATDAKTDRDNQIKAEKEDLSGRMKKLREGDGASVPAGTSAGAGGGAVAMTPTLNGIKNSDERKNVSAFIGTLGLSEGAGYQTLVGQGKFNDKIKDLGKHPNTIGLRTADGPSTAAGIGQITYSTWKSLGHGPNDSFSEDEQNKAIIQLMKRRGIYDDVAKGDWEKVLANPGLGKEWQSIPNGASPNQGKHSKAQFYKFLNESLKKQESANVPSGAGSSAGMGRGSAISFEPLNVTVTHRDESGKQLRPDESMQTRVGPANANTYQD